MTNTYGKSPYATLSDAQALPNNTSVDSTNMIPIYGSYGRRNQNGMIVVAFYASTAITIATGQAFSIEIETYTADTAASARPPFWYHSSGTIKAQSNCHYYVVHKTSADGELKFAAGDLIAEFVVPPRQIYQDDYLQAKFTTDADESSEKIDAFAYLIER